MWVDWLRWVIRPTSNSVCLCVFINLFKGCSPSITRWTAELSFGKLFISIVLWRVRVKGRWWNYPRRVLHPVPPRHTATWVVVGQPWPHQLEPSESDWLTGLACFHYATDLKTTEERTVRSWNATPLTTTTMTTWCCQQQQPKNVTVQKINSNQLPARRV